MTIDRLYDLKRFCCYIDVAAGMLHLLPNKVNNRLSSSRILLKDTVDVLPNTDFANLNK